MTEADRDWKLWIMDNPEHSEYRKIIENTTAYRFFVLKQRFIELIKTIKGITK